MVAELILTKEEEAVDSIEQFDDSVLGKIVKYGSFGLLKESDPSRASGRLPFVSAALILCNLAYTSNAAELKHTMESVTVRGEDAGDWEVIVRRKRQRT